MFHKNKKVAQPGENLVLGKKPEKSLNVGFFGVGKNLFHWCTTFEFTLCTIVVFMIQQNSQLSEKCLSQNINGRYKTKRYNVPFTNVVRFSWLKIWCYFLKVWWSMPKGHWNRSLIQILKTKLVHHCDVLLFNDRP